MRGARGGILFDFFLIVVILAGSAALWFSRAQWKDLLPRKPRIALPDAALPRSWKAEKRAAPDKALDLSRQSAEVQAAVRDLLSREGIADADVVKAYSVERSEKDARWVEATIEVAPGRPIHSGTFLKRLAPSLARRGLSILRDESRDGRWILEIGQNGRIFQRLVLHPAAL